MKKLETEGIKIPDSNITLKTRPRSGCVSEAQREAKNTKDRARRAAKKAAAKAPTAVTVPIRVEATVTVKREIKAGDRVQIKGQPGVLMTVATVYGHAVDCLHWSFGREIKRQTIEIAALEHVTERSK